MIFPPSDIFFGHLIPKSDIKNIANSCAECIWQYWRWYRPRGPGHWYLNRFTKVGRNWYWYCMRIYVGLHYTMCMQKMFLQKAEEEKGPKIENSNRYASRERFGSSDER